MFIFWELSESLSVYFLSHLRFACFSESLQGGSYPTPCARVSGTQNIAQHIYLKLNMEDLPLQHPVTNFIGQFMDQP